MENRTVKIWALGFILMGIALATYKYHFIGFPLSPQQNTPIWIVQAQVSFTGEKGPSKVSLPLPQMTPGYSIVDEDFISGKYGLTLEESPQAREAHWAVRRAKGEQRLYYRITVARDPNKVKWKDHPQFPKVPQYDEPYGSAITAILNDVRAASADVESFTQELLSQLNSDAPNENIELVKGRTKDLNQWSSVIIDILKGVRVPARTLWGFNINGASNELSLASKIQVHNGQRWITFDPFTGAKGIPEHYFVWSAGEKPRLLLSGGHKANLKFSVTKTYAKLLDVVRNSTEHKDSFFIKHSLLNLPIQVQNTYRLMLMVPIGALIVVLLRVYVGLHTFGTFMPILIALSFRETQLWWGIIAFSLIVAFGLFIRFFFERLMLLLIPRLAAILVIVVISMILISTLTNQMEVERLVSVSLFPMVILAMTIERMSIVWEESGFSATLYQGIGSLITAVLGYLAMTNEHLGYLIFVFPELLITVLGFCIWMGKYTGYRISELIRFSDLSKADKAT